MVTCPFCDDLCPRPVVSGYYRCDGCDNHFLLKQEEKPKKSLDSPPKDT